MKVLKRILLWSLASIGTLLVIILATVSVIWLKPDLILTQSRVDSLVDRFAGDLFTKRPDSIRFELRPNGLFGKDIYIDASEFCLKDPEGCFDKVHVELAFRFIRFNKVEIQKVGPIVVLNRSLKFLESKEKPVTKTEDEGPGLMRFISIPQSLVVQEVQIESPQVTFPGKDPVILNVSLKGNSDQLKVLAGAKTATGLTASASIETGFSLDGNKPFAAKLAAEDGWKITGNLEGQANWMKLEADLKGGIEIRNLIPWVHTLAIKNIEVSRHQNLRLSADVVTKLEPKLDFRARESAMPHVAFVTELDGKINVVEKDEVFQYNLQMGPLAQKGIELLIRAEGKYPFPKETEHRYGVEKALVKVSIPHFQTLVQSVKNTSSAVPAPFSALNGKVLLQLGNEDAGIRNEKIPLSLITELTSKEQTVNTQSGGEMIFERAKKKIRLDGKSRIELIRFTLPDIDILTPQAALTADSRIISLKKFEKEQKEKFEEPVNTSESMFELNWKVTTADSGIQINYPILQPYAPVQVEWTMDAKGSYGELKLLPFKIEFYNRKARVNHLRYYLNPGDKIFHYDGKLTIPKTDYTLFISIYDQSGKPKVEFSSEPPLAESDIISVLLFNQTTAELTPDESGSVANTQAAVANRALGLFSIWALSSTPIEAVNFNPSTKVYSARVRLANGLTASIGTNWENTQEVALRKRLGRNFVLSTSVQTDKETNTESKKTLLEWFKRF